MANALDSLREQYPDFYDEFIRLNNYTQTALDGFLTDEGQEALKYFAAELKKFAAEQEVEQSQAEQVIQHEAEASAVLNYDEDHPNGFIPGLRAAQIDPSRAEEFEDPFRFNEFFAPQEETLVERLNQIAAMQEGEKFAEYAQTPGYKRNNSKIDPSFDAVIDACAVRHLAMLSDSEITPKSFNNSRKEEKRRIEVEYYAALYQLCLPEKQAEQMATLEGYTGLMAQIDRLVGQARSQEEIIAKLGIDRNVEDKIKLSGKPVAAQKYLKEMQNIARTTVVASNIRPLQRWFTKPGIAKGFHAAGKFVDMLQKIENSNAFLSQQTNISLSGNPFFMAYRMILSGRSIHNDLKNFQDFTAFKNTFKTPNLQSMGYKRYCSVEGAVKLEESDYRALLGCAKYKDYLKLTGDKPQLSEAQFKQIHKLQAQTEFNQNDFNMIKQLALKDSYEEYKAKLKGNSVDEETFLNAQKYALISRTLDYPEYEKKAGTKAVSRNEYNQLRAMAAPARLKNWRLIGAALSNRQTRKEIMAHSGYFIGSLPFIGQAYGLYGMAKNLVSKNAYLSVYNSGKTVVDSVKNLRKKKFKSWHDVTNSWDDIKKIWINANGLLATVGSFSMMESRLTATYHGAVANVHEFQNSDISLGEHLLNTAASSWQDYKAMMLHRLSLGHASATKEVNSNVSPAQENVSAQHTTSLDDVTVAKMESVGLEGGVAEDANADNGGASALSRDDVDTVSGASLDMAVAAAGNEGGVAEDANAGNGGASALSRDDVDTVSGASLDMAVGAAGNEGDVAEQNDNNNVQSASLDDTPHTTAAPENVAETSRSTAVENDTNAGASASAVTAENETGTAAATGATENGNEDGTSDSAGVTEDGAENTGVDSTAETENENDAETGEPIAVAGDENKTETVENIVPVTSQISEHDGKYAITIGDNEPVNFHFEKGPDHIWHMILEPGDNIENLANIDNEEAAKQVYEHFKDEDHLPRPLRKFMEDYQELHAASLAAESVPAIDEAAPEKVSESEKTDSAEVQHPTENSEHHEGEAVSVETAAPEHQAIVEGSATEYFHGTIVDYQVTEDGEIVCEEEMYERKGHNALKNAIAASVVTVDGKYSLLDGKYTADTWEECRAQQEALLKEIVLKDAAVRAINNQLSGLSSDEQKLETATAAIEKYNDEYGSILNMAGNMSNDRPHYSYNSEVNEKLADTYMNKHMIQLTLMDDVDRGSLAGTGEVVSDSVKGSYLITAKGMIEWGDNTHYTRNDSLVNAIMEGTAVDPVTGEHNILNWCRSNNITDIYDQQEELAKVISIHYAAVQDMKAQEANGAVLTEGQKLNIERFENNLKLLGLSVNDKGEWYHQSSAEATLDNSHTAAGDGHTAAGRKEEAQPAAATHIGTAEPEIVAKGHVHHNQFVTGRYTVNEEGEIAFKPGHFCKCDPTLLNVVRESSTGNLQEGMSFLNGCFHADNFGESRMQQEEIARQITLTYAAVHDMEVKAAAGGVLTEGEKLSIQNFHRSLHQMGLTVDESGEWKYNPQHQPEMVAVNADHRSPVATAAAEAAPAFSSAKVEINGLDVHCQIDCDGNLTTGADWQSIRNDTGILNAIRHSAMQEPGYSFCNGKFNDCSFQDYRFHQEQIAAQLTIQQEVLDALEARVDHGGQLNLNERKFIDNFYRDAAEMGLTVDKSGHWSYVGDKAPLIEHPYGYAATAAAAEQNAPIEHNTPKLSDKPTEQPRVEEAPSKAPAAEQNAPIEHNTPKLSDKPTEQPRVEEVPLDGQKAGEAREEKAEKGVVSEHPESNNANASNIPVHKISSLYFHGTYQLAENEDGASYQVEFNGAVRADPLISRQLREVLQANYDATGKYSLGGTAYENFNAAMLGISEQATSLTKMNAIAEDLMARQGNGETLSGAEKKFLEYTDQKNDLYTQKEYYKNGAVKSETDIRGGITEYKRNGTVSSHMTGQEVFIARGNEYRAQRDSR